MGGEVIQMLYAFSSQGILWKQEPWPVWLLSYDIFMSFTCCTQGRREKGTTRESNADPWLTIPHPDSSTSTPASLIDNRHRGMAPAHALIFLGLAPAHHYSLYKS